MRVSTRSHLSTTLIFLTKYSVSARAQTDLALCAIGKLQAQRDGLVTNFRGMITRIMLRAGKYTSELVLLIVIGSISEYRPKQCVDELVGWSARGDLMPRVRRRVLSALATIILPVA